jgi:hypothetical protein
MFLAFLASVFPTSVVPAIPEPLTTLQDASAPAETWVPSLSTYWMEPPDESGYLSAILAADRGVLHLEAHWAYEDRDTLSVFVGRNFPIEGDLSGQVTPRIGIAGGDSDGIVPAVGLGLDWKKLSFSTDVEYMIGTSSETEDFLYSWSELTYAFTERFSAGLVGERTNVFDQDLSVDRGVVFGVSLGKAQLTAYVFNPDLDDPYVVIALGGSF